MLEMREKEFQELVGYIKNNFGINLEKKKKLIEGRMGNYIQDMGFSQFSEYIQFLYEDNSGTELSNLVNKLTTNHTFFMREEEHFNYLKSIVLPDIARTFKEKDIRIWSAGCSSGEEPYTIAMLMHEFFGGEKYMWDTKVLATDISAKVLAVAKRGVYSQESVDILSKQWKTKYFRAKGPGMLELNENIKAEVIFRSFNLMQDVFPFKKKFHIIFCRNVMIYFDSATKRELIRKFNELTEKGGYLFIGHSESIGREDTGYTYIQPAIYRKL